MRPPPNNDASPAIEEPEVNHQLEKILNSATFRNAAGLQKFLQYVVGKTVEGLSQEIKEYSIAVEVLGKTSDYDPRLDTTVRVQAHRLREKLEEYYAGEGVGDEIIIELPKGHYVPQFSRRLQSVEKSAGGILNTAESTHEAGARLPSPPTPPQQRIQAPAFPKVTAAIAAIVLFIAGVVLSPLIRQIPPFKEDAAIGTSSRAGRASSAVWGNFWRDSSGPIVAYSNSMFLSTETSDLLRLKAADVDGLGAPATGGDALKFAENPRLVQEAGPVFYNDEYTGTGEVMAVYYLDRLFSQSHLPPTVERSQLVSTDDLRSHNVIFLGSVLENPILSGLSLNETFVFEQPQHPPTLWRSRIVNLHPQPGEKSFYEIERDPKTQVLSVDYAVISFLPGVAPGREIVILAGLTTIGTEAAAQFITSRTADEELLDRLGATTPRSSVKRLPRFFQAVLRVDIRKDEILKINYVAGSAIRPAGQNF